MFSPQSAKGCTVHLLYPRKPLAAASVRIRPWRSPDDLACIEGAATDPAIPAGTTVPPTYSEAAGLAFLARQQGRLTNGDGISQAVTDAATDQAVGLYLDRRPQPWIAGLGYWLVPSARGRHLATPAVRLVTDWALRELDVARVEAWVAPDNLPSQCVLQHAGFQLEGQLRNFLQLRGRTSDGLVYSRIPDPDGP
jgi:ribosomal-protein-alanine N-acetyltransferase